MANSKGERFIPFAYYIHPNFDNVLSRLSARAKKACKGIEAYTIHDLARYASKFSFAYLRNCGKKTKKELLDTVIAYYPNYREQFKDEDLSELSGEASPNADKEPKTVGIPDSPVALISAPMKRSLGYIYEMALSSCEDELVAATFRSQYPSALAFFGAMYIWPETIFDPHDNLTLDQNRDLWLLRIDMTDKLMEVPCANRKDNLFLHQFYKSFNHVRKEVNTHYNNLIIERIPVKARLLVDAELQARSALLSRRPRNVLDSVGPDLFDIIEFLDDVSRGTKLGIRGFGDKCAQETNSVFGGFKNFIIHVSTMPDEPLQQLVISQLFPFLSETGKEFVFDFFRNRNAYPLFYILFNAICNAEERETQIYDMTHGISGEAVTLNEIAKKFGLTRERIRQIVAGYSPKAFESVISLFTCEQYPFLGEDAIDPEVGTELLANAELNGDERFDNNSFAGLVKLVSGHVSHNFGKCRLLFSDRLSEAFDWRIAWEEITETLRGKVVEEREIPLDPFLIRHTLDSSADPTLLRDIVAKIITANFDATVDDDHVIHLRKNSIIIADELYNIIKDAGRPLSFKELSNAFFERFPEHGNKAISTIKVYLHGNDKIRSIGKTATYTLAEWDINTKSMKGLIAEILSESETPLSLQDLVDILKSKGRITNANSINTNIWLDSKYNFVRMKGGLIGLADKMYDEAYEIISPEHKTREPFEVRLQQLIDFVDTHGRFPFSKGEGMERTLYNWQKNLAYGYIEGTPEQMAQYRHAVESRQQYRMTVSEYEFARNCEAMKDFVSRESRLPDFRSDLYRWFQKARWQSNTLTGKKAEMYSDLMHFLAHKCL